MSRPFELRKPLVHQIKPDVGRRRYWSRTRIGGVRCHGCACQVNAGFSHRAFREGAPLGGFFNDMAIPITRGESHLSINFNRIPAQLLFDRTMRFNEAAPIERAQ